MTYLRKIPTNEIWLQQLFHAKAAQNGGVIRRSVQDVERKVGRDALELEVRRRQFHLIEAGGQFIVICSKGGLRVIV
ncbi:N-(5'-phosphoribosyl)anthranilate isomerase [Nereida sp. MMG025]|uniref:N-(5'-phosphoribosyl)anthranilate isomerase n=1 Tax=Nereida sp. MMG025 TaxID=2909981 RepID=UPI001F19AEC6|nr:N-(5'-phosphoribosyl)anthranilate isomerase [Nereida sp. MMG025]MCF6443365.1 N-(5'-phosphoribosyl)anthranilate isomerase [Nereida sp. MMG025]